MNDRYTSPETSRALAEAGLEQRIGDYPHGAARFSVDTCWMKNKDDTWRLCPRGVDWSKYDLVRALDLTDILAELTRPRPEEKDARPLCDAVSVDLCNSTTVDHPFTSMARAFDHEENEMASIETGSPVEAAALVFLALLRERAKP